MNTQKLVSSFAILFSLASGAFTYEEESVSPEASPIGLTPHEDMAWYENDATPDDPVQWVNEIVIAAPTAVQAPAKAVSVWACKAPRKLENDASMTVRECGWVSR